MVKTYITGILLLGFLFQYTKAQEYQAIDLDPVLTKNANAILRLFENTFEIKDTAKAVNTCHYVITVLNPNGDHFAQFDEMYDPFSKFQDLTGTIYNKLGGVIKKIKSSDFNDVSAVSNFSIYDDNRMKFTRPLVNTYPYTVEYRYTQVYSNYLQIYPWAPIFNYDLSVEKAIYHVTFPKGFNISYRALNNALEPTRTESANTVTLKMNVEKLPAIESELLSPGLLDIIPIIYFIPEYYKIGDYTCKTDSWKNLGLSFAKLNNQPNQLSEKTLVELKAIKEKATSQKDLVRMVYEYMQAKTRYVSIQLGIGGFKPFDASVVDKYGYGDCKALSNYTKILLKNVGITSNYALVRGDNNTRDILTDQPFNQFNHVILSVPLEKDTIWLECTSQSIPFGFEGKFTDNRHALLIKDEGGELVKTNYYSQQDNQQRTCYEVNFTADGSMDAKINIIYTGLQYDDMFRITLLSPDKQKETLYEDIDLPNFDIKNFHIQEDKSEIPSMKIDLNVSATKYATTVGNRLLFAPNMLSKRQPLQDFNKERKSRMRIRYAYADVDSAIIHLPEGYQVESVPKNFELSSVFGTYKTKAEYDASSSTLRYIRELKINDGIYPAEQYKDYMIFIKSISQNDNAKVSLLKKN